MQDRATIQRDKNRISVKGPIAAANLTGDLALIEGLIDECNAKKPVEISLRGISQYNCLLLSFMLSCVRYAQGQSRELYFYQTSKSLHSILVVYNLTQILGKFIKRQGRPSRLI